MLDSDVGDLIRLIRARGTDLTTVEVKAAGGGLPRSLRETLSAFSNDVGGTIILGLDERRGFQSAQGFNAAKIRDDLASMCSDELHPPVRADIEIADFEDSVVVVAEIVELDSRHKPCYVKARGEYGGSYVRGGDGDRKLTEYEISLIHANRGQPNDDHQPVRDATFEDLDADAVARLLRRVREREAVAFAGIPDERALQRLGVLVSDNGGDLVPSLAGLLALGLYPQQFFPQLNVTFVAIPATSKDTIPRDGPRFLDNRALNGSVPALIEGAVTSVIRNMSVRGRVRGIGREDEYDYPVEALREAITNALMHRDYSPQARGTQVQIEMYQDRLQIRSPGGLFGTVTEEDLGREGTSSSRNAHLARLLQDVTIPGTTQVVCENRGTGIPAMIQSLRQAGMTTPKFDSRILRFLVTFPKHALLDAETLDWIAGLGQPDLSNAQCMALALMREGRSVTNGVLRQLGLERHDATVVLADLVSRGLALKLGGRRYANYVLAGEAERIFADSQSPLLSAREDEVGAEPVGLRRDRIDEIDRLFDNDDLVRAADVMKATGLKAAMVSRYLNRLIDRDRIVATAPTQSRHRAYRRKHDEIAAEHTT